MNEVIIYIHGQGGSADEAAHYRSLFPQCAVIGFDYTAQTPWEAAEEFPAFLKSVRRDYDTVTVIANSIGAFFAMNAWSGADIDRAFFISPVADMEKLIAGMMRMAGVTEQELCERGEIETPFSQTLSWQYLCYVREHPLRWTAPTHILYGENDTLTDFETITDFANSIHATLTVMPEGEHWFHTPQQMDFLDRWILSVL